MRKCNTNKLIVQRFQYVQPESTISNLRKSDKRNMYTLLNKKSMQCVHLICISFLGGGGVKFEVSDCHRYHS